MPNFSSFRPSVWPGPWVWFENWRHILYFEETRRRYSLDTGDEGYVVALHSFIPRDKQFDPINLCGRFIAPVLRIVTIHRDCCERAARHHASRVLQSFTKLCGRVSARSPSVCPGETTSKAGRTALGKGPPYLCRAKGRGFRDCRWSQSESNWTIRSSINLRRGGIEVGVWIKVVLDLLFLNLISPTYVYLTETAERLARLTTFKQKISR